MWGTVSRTHRSFAARSSSQRSGKIIIAISVADRRRPRPGTPVGCLASSSGSSATRAARSVPSGAGRPMVGDVDFFFRCAGGADDDREPGAVAAWARSLAVKAVVEGMGGNVEEVCIATVLDPGPFPMALSLWARRGDAAHDGWRDPSNGKGWPAGRVAVHVSLCVTMGTSYHGCPVHARRASTGRSIRHGGSPVVRVGQARCHGRVFRRSAGTSRRSWRAHSPVRQPVPPLRLMV